MPNIGPLPPLSNHWQRMSQEFMDHSFPQVLDLWHWGLDNKGAGCIILSFLNEAEDGVAARFFFLGGEELLTGLRDQGKLTFDLFMSLTIAMTQADRYSLATLTVHEDARNTARVAVFDGRGFIAQWN